LRQLYILSDSTAGLMEEAETRAKAFHTILTRLENEMWGASLDHLILTQAYLLRDLTLLDTFDWALRLLVSRILPSDWGDVEGVTAHMSSRGYCELHIWTTKQRGRCIEVMVGNRFQSSKIPTFDQYEDRCRTHGTPSLHVYVKTKDGSAAAEFVRDALAETEPGPLERLAATHREKP
jgi:hypothetical protein